MDPQRRHEQEEVAAERTARSAARLDELLASFCDVGLRPAPVERPVASCDGTVRTFLNREFGGVFSDPNPVG